MLQSMGSRRAGFCSCGMRAQSLRSMWDFPRTRDQTRVPCIGRWIVIHCATREVPSFLMTTHCQSSPHTNNAAQNILVCIMCFFRKTFCWVNVHICLNICKYQQIIFQEGCGNSYSHHQCIKVTISPHLHQKLAFFF